MSSTTEATTAVGPETSEGTLSGTVNHLAVMLSYGAGTLSAGDVASLRRMDPAHPSAAFFKLVSVVLDKYLPAHQEARLQAENRWAAVVQGLAHLGRLHKPGARLGTALADAGYSELRFARLLHSDAARLLDEIPSLARYLAARDVRVDWADAARLILYTEERVRERDRRAIASDYYRAMARDS